MEERLTYSVAEVATLTGRSQAWVRDMIKSGQIPSTKIGSAVLIPASELRDLLSGRSS